MFDLSLSSYGGQPSDQQQGCSLDLVDTDMRKALEKLRNGV